MSVKANQRHLVHRMFLFGPIEQRIILFIGDVVFGAVALFFALPKEMPVLGNLRSLVAIVHEQEMGTMLGFKGQ